MTKGVSKNRTNKSWFKKGHIPWHTGLTKETDIRLKKISESKIGTKLTEKHKKSLKDNHWTKRLNAKLIIKKISKSKIGRHPYFKPGAKEIRNKRISESKKGPLHPGWKGGRKNYLAKQRLIKDNYTCKKCGFRDIEIMEVDHIKPRHLRPDLEWDIKNLHTLCPNCHKKKTIREYKKLRKIRKW